MVKKECYIIFTEFGINQTGIFQKYYLFATNLYKPQLVLQSYSLCTKNGVGGKLYYILYANINLPFFVFNA